MTGIVPYRTVPYYTPYGNTYRVLITAVPCGTYYKYCTGVQAGGGYQNALFFTHPENSRSQEGIIKNVIIILIKIVVYS